MSAWSSVVTLLRQRQWTLGTAESLTAGRVCAAVADVPGCSDVLRGGIVAYHADLKGSLLHLPSEALDQGVVSQVVAEQMAVAVRGVLGADVGVATTGVAGPEPHGGEPVGSVWIAVAIPGTVRSQHLSLSGDREQIREATVRASRELLMQVVTGGRPDPIAGTVA